MLRCDSSGRRRVARKFGRLVNQPSAFGSTQLGPRLIAEPSKRFRSDQLSRSPITDLGAAYPGGPYPGGP
jgi:hypothetical protein